MQSLVQKKDVMKKFRAKAFTLVETIVVMLIIALLATMFIPNMLGYIERTHQTAAIMECRSTVIAAQTILNQTYAYHTADFEGVYKDNVYTIKTSSYNTGKSNVLNLSSYNGMDSSLNGVICGLAEADGEVVSIRTDDSCRLEYLVYAASNGQIVEYDSSIDSSYSIME